MKVGDKIETGIWLDGRETPQDRAEYERDVRQAIADLCADHGMVHGPVRLMELKPGDERTPAVPDHIQGPDVRLLAVEADIVGELSLRRGFIGDLEPKDLDRLRSITRAKWLAEYPWREPTLDELDAIIEEFGPEAALDDLRASAVMH